MILELKITFLNCEFFFAGVVLFLTGEVIYAWSSGQLRQEKELALANFQMDISTNGSSENS